MTHALRFGCHILVAALLAGCHGSAGGDTGATGEPASTSGADPTTGNSSGVAATSASTGAAASSTGSTGSTGGSTETSGTGESGASSGDDTTTSGDGTTTDTDGPLDPSCTYPGSTSDGPDSPDLAPECACIDGDGNLACEDTICTFGGHCDPPGMFEESCHGTWIYNAAGLDCAISAARDGIEGTIRWNFSANSGFSHRSGFLHIVAGRRAIRQDDRFVDLGGSVDDTELWALKDPAYFADCLELPTVCERMSCFFAGTEDKALSLCHPAFTYDDW